MQDVERPGGRVVGSVEVRRVPREAGAVSELREVVVALAREIVPLRLDKIH